MAGWSGRWFGESGWVLDPEGNAADSRDSAETDDVDALLSISEDLIEALESGSWRRLSRAPLLASHDAQSLALEDREMRLEEHVPSLVRICSRYVTRLGELIELQPVARVRRPARRALERLSAHTEDWAALTIKGPVPRRALAVTRDLNPDLYENRMVVELIHPVLSTALGARLRRLQRVERDLADLAAARHEGTHQRRTRLYAFWGAGAERVDESSRAAADALQRVRSLHQQISRLRGSLLLSLLTGKRTGQRCLRRTNVIQNDRHYHAAGLIWEAYERPPVIVEVPEQRAVRLQQRHEAFFAYVFGLLVRSLDELGYAPHEDQLPSPGLPVTLTGRWCDATLHVTGERTLILESAGRRTRIVPLLDMLTPSDDATDVARRWTTAVEQVEEPTILAYLAPTESIRHLEPPLALQMLAGRPETRLLASGVPVSPLETTSLERLSRAIAVAVLEPALLSFPAEIRDGDQPIPRRLIARILEANIQEATAPPLLHLGVPDRISLRRQLLQEERTSLSLLIGQLKSEAGGPGRAKDLKEAVEALASSVEAAEALVGRLFCCPTCGIRGDASQVAREGDLFMLTCRDRSCMTRWGHERCGACAQRVPIIEPGGTSARAQAGPGWIERTFGTDCLSSPCWSSGGSGRYICPRCLACPLADTAEAVDCMRCASAMVVS